MIGWSKSATLLERFEALYIPEPNSGCWLWIGADMGGKWPYGRLTFHNVREAAHRIAWRLFRGPIPDGLDVLHKCDVACCVNPDHLFLGTSEDNSRDMMRKGRHPRARLTRDAVLALRQGAVSPREIVEKFGVSLEYAQRLKSSPEDYWQW